MVYLRVTRYHKRRRHLVDIVFRCDSLSWFNRVLINFSNDSVLRHGECSECEEYEFLLEIIFWWAHLQDAETLKGENHRCADIWSGRVIYYVIYIYLVIQIRIWGGELNSFLKWNQKYFGDWFNFLFLFYWWCGGEEEYSWWFWRGYTMIQQIETENDVLKNLWI